MRATALFLFLLMACGEGGVTDTDGAPKSDAGGDAGSSLSAHPHFDVVGGVWLIEWNDTGTDQTFVYVRAGFTERPSLPPYDVIASEGVCTYYKPSAPVLCDPACQTPKFCSPQGVCILDGSLSAGDIEITGAAVPLAVIKDEIHHYSVTGTSGVHDLFGPNDSISIVATGDTLLGAFGDTIGGVADMDVGWTQMEVSRSADTLVEWTVQQDDAQVELIVQLGWHGAAPTDIIWCSAPDVQGQLTIPASLGALMPPPIPGPSLFQHISLMRRVKRVIVERGGRFIEMSVASERLADVR